jgi:hypothetical protein
MEHKIFSESDLSRWSRGDIAKLLGIGPSAFPVLDQALADAKVEFKAPEKRGEIMPDPGLVIAMSMTFVAAERKEQPERKIKEVYALVSTGRRKRSQAR